MLKYGANDNVDLRINTSGCYTHRATSGLDLELLSLSTRQMGSYTQALNDHD